MKINTLLAILNQLDPNLEVLISEDAEGNGYSPCSSWSFGTIDPQNSDEFYDDADSDQECGLAPGERENFTKVIVLWP